MTNSSSIINQAPDIWSKGEVTQIIAGRWSKFNLLQYQRTNIRKPTKLCNTGSISATTQSIQQDIKADAHFGPHLLKNLKVGLDLKWNNPRKEYQTGSTELVKPVKKCGEFMYTSIKSKSVSHKGVFPFSKELILDVQRNWKMSGRPFSAHGMVLSTPYAENFEWGYPVNQTSFSFGGEARSVPFQYFSPWMVTQPQRLDTQLQPTEGAKQNFRELGLTWHQIVGLEFLGFNVSRFLPRLNASYQHDPRIPPSYDLDGVLCYWCESHEHIAYGVAYILKRNARVVGVAVKRNKSSPTVALIQMATTDVVLLIPMNASSLPAPAALKMIFRDPVILKTGVQIKENLWALWVDFQIESNSFVELNDLFELSWKKFGSLSSSSKIPLKLREIASSLGYQIWDTQYMTFSDWESRPLSSKQLHYASRNALLTILVFWSIILGRKVTKPLISDLQVNVEKFVNSVCTRGPISKMLGSHSLKKGFELGFGEIFPEVVRRE